MAAKDLVGNLQKWLQEEMLYKPSGSQASFGIPNAKQLSNICRGSVTSYFEYILKHVCSKALVHEVKGNLQVSSQLGSFSSQQDSSLLKLRQEKQGLISRRKVLEKAISLLEIDIKALKGQLLIHDVAAGGNKLHEKRHRAALLCVFHDQLLQTVAVFDDHTKQLQDNTLDLLNTAQIKLSYSNENGGLLKEGKCLKDVREATVVLKTFLHKLLSGQFSGNVDHLTHEKGAIVNYLEGLMESHSPHECVHALECLAQEQTDTLRDRLVTTNVQDEAKKLKLKFERGGVTDPSHPFYRTKVELHSLSELLKSEEAATVRIFIRKLESEQQMSAETKRTKELETELKCKLETYYKSDESARELAYLVVDAERSVAENTAQLKAFENRLDEIQEELAQYREGTKRLANRHQQITKFSQVVEGKEQVIQTLLRQHTNAKDKLDGVWKQMHNYVEGMLGSTPVEIQKERMHLKDVTAQELELFSKCSLPYLQLIHLNSGRKMCVMDLSINKYYLTPAESTNCKTLEVVASLMNQSLHKDPSCLLQAIVQLQARCDLYQFDTKPRLPWNREKQQDFSQGLSKLLLMIPQVDREKEATLGPVLDESLSRAKQTCIQIEALQQLIREWWEQPAAVCCPWVTVDDRSFQKWQDQWKVIITQLQHYY